MIALLADAIEAHGGLSRWNARRSLAATIVMGGEFWALKGVDEDQSPRHMRIDLHREWASIEPFGKAGQHTDFTPERIAIQTETGKTVAERRNPRASFAQHDMRTNWDPLHHAYFNGYALWTYLTAPFLLAAEGVKVREIEPWREEAEVWRGLRATFPPWIASHSTEQEFLFRARHAHPPARLQGGDRRKLSRGAVHIRSRQRRWDQDPDQGASLSPARRLVADARHTDGMD